MHQVVNRRTLWSFIHIAIKKCSVLFAENIIRLIFEVLFYVCLNSSSLMRNFLFTSVCLIFRKYIYTLSVLSFVIVGMRFCLLVWFVAGRLTYKGNYTIDPDLISGSVHCLCVSVCALMLHNS